MISALKRKSVVSVLLTMLVSATLIMLNTFGAFSALENTLLNKQFKASQTRDDIVILALDDRSLAAKNSGENVTSRENMTQIFKNVLALNPKAVAVDFLFNTPTDSLTIKDLKVALSRLISDREENMVPLSSVETIFGPLIITPNPADAALAEVISHNKVILAVAPMSPELIEERPIKDEEIFRSIDSIHSKAKHHGNISIQLDNGDNLVRTYFTHFTKENGQEIKSLSVKAAELAGSPYVNQIPVINRSQKFFINYFGEPGSYTRISAVDALNGDITKSDIEGKIILFGPTSVSLGDLEHTPIAPKLQMPGIEIHANALQTILDGAFLTKATPLIDTLIIIGIVGLAVATCLYLSIRTSAVCIALITIMYFFSNSFAFKSGMILNQLYPYLALILAVSLSYIYKFFIESKEKSFITGAFNSYVSPDVLKQIQNDPRKLMLGGEEKMVTVFFSDIKNFTHISEALRADEVVSLLNEFFSEMSDIIIQNEGTVDKFEGDAIMAVFGAPLTLQNHAIYACNAALKFQEKLAELRESLKARNLPELYSRVGINSGIAIAGNVGSKDRFDYTVMGDTVNLGSRLEGANKFYGTNIMVGHTTYEFAKEHFVFRKLDKLKVKGKDKAEFVYELMAVKSELTSSIQNIASSYESALELYFNGQFQQALSAFNEVLTLSPNDVPSMTMIKRIEYFLQNPPQNFDGSFTLSSK